MKFDRPGDLVRRLKQAERRVAAGPSERDRLAAQSEAAFHGLCRLYNLSPADAPPVHRPAERRIWFYTRLARGEAKRTMRADEGAADVEP